MTQGWKRLGAEIVARRVHLGWPHQSDLIAATGLSRPVVGNLERGRRESYDPATLAKVERALGWDYGSCLLVVNGMQPVPASDPELDRLLEIRRGLSQDKRVLLLAFAETLANARL